MIPNKTILFCPLDWGLGHACRSVYYIHKLLEQGDRVIIASDNAPLSFLRKEFPGLDWVRFPSYYKIHYSSIFPMPILAPFFFLKIIIGSAREHSFLKKLLKIHKPDIVISDNRFGLWNKKYFTVYITHQVSIRVPRWAKFLEKPVYKLHKWIIQKYTRCWIPDKQGPDNLTGELSGKFPLPSNASFTGIASRFLLPENRSSGISNPYDIVVILSGPEPQRTILEDKLLQILQNSDKKIFFLRGKPEETGITPNKYNIKMANHLPSGNISLLLSQAGIIICRSGYTMIMDLAALNKKALLIPTPGQTEQEYLARYMNKCGRHISLSQNKISELWIKIEELKALKPKPFKHSINTDFANVAKL
ncbi:MAG: hypothetical protein KAT38_12295 [Bacteroidales bacterium]|nr:hypothetical protein [Bacteroidales bacterium]